MLSDAEYRDVAAFVYGRTTHRLRRVGGELKMCRKKVVLVNAAEPLPNLSFLI
jgi:hypothetical protein